MHLLSTLSKSVEQRPFSFPASAFLFFGLFFLFPFLLARSGFAAQITLAWDPNTEGNLAGYKIYYKGDTPSAPYDGTGANEGDSPIDVPLEWLIDEDSPEYKLTGLSDTKTYYFVVTAYDYDTRESGYSIEVSTGSTASAASTGGSGGGGGGGCLIATAAFGSEMGWHVRILSEFRDKRLLSNHFGRELVGIYYKLSPPVADYLRHHPTARTVVRYGLIPVIGVAYLSLHIHPIILLLITAFLFSGALLCYRRLLNSRP